VMPDLFTPLLVLVICLLSAVPERLSRCEQVVLAASATFMIASQQSSLPLACILFVVLGGPIIWWGEKTPALERRIAAASSVSVIPSPRQRSWSRGTNATLASPTLPANRRLLLLALPPTLAILSLCTANLAAHGRFAISPFGNIFLLARVIYDGPGMTTLRRDCPTSNWRLCQYIDRFPATSDEFLWSTDSPLYLAGGPKIVSDDAGAIIQAALMSDPAGEAQAAIRNMLEQLQRFDSGDGLEPWPAQVSPWIQRDLPAAEQAAYASARQQTGRLTVPKFLATTHQATALAGVAGTMLLLPIALRRRAPCARFLLAVLLALPISAAITGGLSAPHDRYQSRIMWLPPFIAVVSLMALLRPRE
jgi:hypothetical protein